MAAYSIYRYLLKQKLALIPISNI